MQRQMPKISWTFGYNKNYHKMYPKMQSLLFFVYTRFKRYDDGRNCEKNRFVY